MSEGDGVLSSLPDQAAGVGAVRRVLDALGQVLPEEGYGHLTRLDIRHGWGNVLNIRLYSPCRQHPMDKSSRPQSDGSLMTLLVLNVTWSKSCGTQRDRRRSRADRWGPLPLRRSRRKRDAGVIERESRRGPT